MRAYFIEEDFSLALKEIPTPEPGPGEIRLCVEAAGLCGTDLHILQGKYPQATRPEIMGHEFAGVVDAVGEGVHDFAVGDKVAADPNMYCGECEWCQVGAYNLCVDFCALGIDRPGALAEYMIVKTPFAVHLPDHVSTTAGALIEPLSCAIHSFDRSMVTGPGAMLIYGGGMIGLASLVYARSLGLDVHVVEPHASRRKVALELGAVEAVAPGEALSRDEFPYVMDATGVATVIQEAFTHVGLRGTMMQVGAADPSARIELSPYDVFRKEMRVVGSFSVADCYVKAAEAMSTVGEVMEKLVTHTFSLGDLPSAFEAMKSPDALKIHIDPRR